MYRINEKTGVAALGEPGQEVAIIGADGIGKARFFDGSALHVLESGAELPTGDLRLAAPDYPGAVPTDSDEFYHRLFRVLSCSLIEGHWIDLRDEKMMQKATKLFGNITLYKNHGGWDGYDVDRWIGQSLKPAFTKSLGVPGVDAVYRFDRTRAEAEAVIRGLQIDPPAIRCTSAAFAFKSRRSHADMGSSDFYANMGREFDGEIVRWIVTEILRVFELSMVYAGADRNATALSVFMPGSESDGVAAKVGEQQQTPEGHKMSENNHEARVKELEQELEAAQNQIAELSPHAEKIAAIGQHSAEEIKAALQFQSARLTDARERAKKAYLASRTPDQPESKAMLGVIERMSHDEAEEMAVEFRGAMEERHEAKCRACGSSDVTRLSSARPEIPNVDPKGGGEAKAAVAKPVKAYKMRPSR